MAWHCCLHFYSGDCDVTVPSGGSGEQATEVAGHTGTPVGARAGGPVGTFWGGIFLAYKIYHRP